MVYAVCFISVLYTSFSLDVNNGTQVLCLHQSYMWGRNVYIGVICVAVRENEAYVGSIPGYTVTILWPEYYEQRFALHIDGLVQDGSISSALAMEMLTAVLH